MKFVVAVVMLACAVGVQSSLLAGHYAPAVSYVTSAVHPGAPWGLGGWGAGPAAVAVHAGTAWGNSGPGLLGVPGLLGGHGLLGGYPGISLSQGPHGALAAAPLISSGHGHGGVYVAKTRGAVHTAPLAGHINSATSLNLAPAPGTL